MLTVQLNNGVRVLAKVYHGTVCAKTYANRTQAAKVAAQIGGTVHGRFPFYVVSPERPGMENPAPGTP